ncbi:MAG: phosphoglycerate kinase, partial [Actinomycetota bacterium]|nr:phosphoglycerate kinase [Actinomycetota bacterium]
MPALVQVDSPGQSWAAERVLVRADLNAPLEPGPGGTPQVADDARIRASVATLQYLLDQGAAVAVCSHLGRPKGQRVDDLSLAP